ncbi:MAG: hypothetical protein MJ158_00720 [Alphaproteobacteria bacterium]|nr:hypothetical protein [Alphaproteobacteria bacterium]
MKKILKILFVCFCSISVVNCYGASSRNTKVARAATTQKAINMGTKVEESKASSSPCQDKYNACMDTGCMLDNDSGGRCQCSDKIKDLKDTENKLKKKDIQSQKMMTDALDIVENGDEVEDLMDDVDIDSDSSDYDFDVASDSVGEALRQEMHDICMEKIPECKAQVSLLKNLYLQKIKSDCAGFENALKQQNMASKDKRATAKKAVRAAAMDNYTDSNKYDLGQCMIEFTKCMQTTAECGEDWTGCVGTVARDAVKESKIDSIAVAGQNSSILIAKSTMEVLENKKIICEGITNQCKSVKDDVWDAFLQNSISDIKLAESKSESNLRTSCLTNISNCFINACKDNIDSADPDSYDMCLSRPETMKSLCRVELEPCLDATGGAFNEPEKSTLWPSVLSKLSAMRVDVCTDELQKCLQSDDRCGSDYSKCVGLDTNIIIHMCPYDKLVGCQNVYGNDAIKTDNDIYEKIAQIIQGTILNIDNDMLQTCENAVDKAMTNVCGDKDSCSKFATENNLGAGSLKYQVCQYRTESPDSTAGFEYFDCRESIDLISDAELGRDKNSKTGELGNVLPFAGVISGTIRWESIVVDDNGNIDASAYIQSIEKDKTITDAERTLVKSEVEQLTNDINRLMTMIENDNMVQYCINGREVPGITDRFKQNKARFPNIGKMARKIIASAALKQAKENYYAKYDKLAERMQQDFAQISQRLLANEKANQNEIKREACVNMAAVSAFAKAPVGQNLTTKIIIGILVCAAIIVATVFTCGTAAGAGFAVQAGVVVAGGFTGGEIAVMTVGAAVVATGVGLMAADAVTAKNEKVLANEQDNYGNNTQIHGEFYDNQWNYQEKITTDWDEDKLVCKKCVAVKKCKKPKWHLFSDRSCAEWETNDFVDSHCTEIGF